MAESSQAWVTLATNDSYCLGALVLAHSLRRVGTTRRLVVMVTRGVTQPMEDQLKSAFDEVRLVDVLDSQDAANLALLARPDLGITFTKLHCWRLSNYSKCVFLDADTVVLQPCDELFDRDELSAAPDPGWPDCFNSGVFVFKPSEDTYQSLLSLALSSGSFDGGDQGLLNTYFSDWATRDINRHLSFLYNMCAPSHYSYLPAFKQFGEGVKIAHFIGPNKPWSQYFDSETRQVRPARGAEHLRYLLQFWWDLFCAHVHPRLTGDMEHTNDPPPNYEPPPPSPPQQQSHRLLIILPQLEPYTAETLIVPETSHSLPPPPTQPIETETAPRYTMEHFSKPLKPIRPPDPPPLIPEYPGHHYQHSRTPSPELPSFHKNVSQSSETSPICQESLPETCFPFEISEPSPELESNQEVIYDPENSEMQAGLASAFSQMTLGAPSPAATVEMQEHLRRAAWEQGNVDYMGADAFDNIWRKIMDTVSKPSSSPPQ